MEKKIVSFIIVLAVLTTIVLSSIKADTFPLESSIMTDEFSTVHFNTRGNDFQGVFLINHETLLTTGETITLNNGQQKICSGQLGGYYFNSQRGNRVRPLDESSLIILRNLDASYNGLALSGGFFTRCEGDFTRVVHGQITHNWRGTTYTLLAGVAYNFTGGLPLGTYSGTSLFASVGTHYILSHYVWDANGSIGHIIDNIIYEGISAISGAIHLGNATTLANNYTFVFASGSNDYVLFSGRQFTSSGDSWNGSVLPPTPASGTGVANIGEVGLPASGSIYFSLQAGATGTTLVTSGGMFVVDIFVSLGQSGNIIYLYRSQDGTTRQGNSPSTTCTLNAERRCQFSVNYLGYFAGVSSGAAITNPGGGGGGGGGGTTLPPDNCLYITGSNNNLPGANPSGIDYSPSYYDDTCEGGQHNLPIITGGCTTYTTELNRAYDFAYYFHITTIPDCVNVDMYGTLLRKDLAKMMVNFAENVFVRTGIMVNNPKCATFSDITNETAETKNYIKKACEYGFMGLEPEGTIPQDVFNPYQRVPRAQFGTVISRFLWKTAYGTTNGKLYYVKHLQALKLAGLMNNISTPFMLEVRGRVMLTMRRVYTEFR